MNIFINLMQFAYIFPHHVIDLIKHEYQWCSFLEDFKWIILAKFGLNNIRACYIFARFIPEWQLDCLLLISLCKTKHTNYVSNIQVPYVESLRALKKNHIMKWILLILFQRIMIFKKKKAFLTTYSFRQNLPVNQF